MVITWLKTQNGNALDLQEFYVKRVKWTAWYQHSDATGREYAWGEVEYVRFLKDIKPFFEKMNWEIKFEDIMETTI
jgi:hypothetical protein